MLHLYTCTDFTIAVQFKPLLFTDIRYSKKKGRTQISDEEKERHTQIIGAESEKAVGLASELVSCLTR